MSMYNHLKRYCILKKTSMRFKFYEDITESTPFIICQNISLVYVFQHLTGTVLATLCLFHAVTAQPAVSGPAYVYPACAAPNTTAICNPANDPDCLGSNEAWKHTYTHCAFNSYLFLQHLRNTLYNILTICFKVVFEWERNGSTRRKPTCPTW